MSKISAYNKEGKEMGSASLPKEIFELKDDTGLLHQIVVSQMSNRRKVIAHTKDRSQVSGGGKKPWRQKGTGRARHGSTRSPIWIGGGITFGPTNARNFKKDVPRKARRKALFVALSLKAKAGSLIVFDQLKLEKASTRGLKSSLDKLPCKDSSCLIAIPEMDKNVILSGRNISKVKVMQIRDLNALDVLSFKYLIITIDGIKKLKEIFIEKEEKEPIADKPAKVAEKPVKEPVKAKK